MKFKNHSLCGLAMLLVAALLVACTPADSNPVSTDDYAVYADGGLLDGDDCLVMNDHSYSYNLDCPTTTPANTVITTTLNGKEYTLHYARSLIAFWNEEVYIFESEDKSLSIQYLANNMQLLRIILADQDMSLFKNMTLAEYEAWIKDFVNQYYTEDWDSYLKAYQTWYDGTSGWTSVPSFLTDVPDGAELDTRVFHYIKQYGELRTNDLINIRLDFKDNKITIGFNVNKFEQYDVNLDVEKMQEAVRDYVTARLRGNDTLQDIFFEYGELTNQGGNILCRWKITVKVQNKAGETLTGDYYVLVDVPNA